jgi:biopolymer transport protein TolR
MAYRRRRMMAEINIIPLVDVVLVLLVVFMMTAPMLTQGVEVDLPDTRSAPMRQETEPLVVTVRADGGVFLQKSRVANPREQLVSKIRAIRRESPGRPVVLNGDARAPYAAVARTLDLLRRGGIRSVGLQTEPAGG